MREGSWRQTPVGSTLHQIGSLAIISGMLALFVSDRLRYDLIAALALSAALLDVVPANKAFGGFSSSVVIIIASVLVVSGDVAISGAIDNAMRRLMRILDSNTLQVGALRAAVTSMSAFVKNVGALGVFMPVAIQAAERHKRPVSRCGGCEEPWSWTGCVPDGGGVRRGLRLPCSDRPSEQHLGDGTGRLCFSDYWRLGLPLSIVVAVCNTWLIVLTSPLR